MNSDSKNQNQDQKSGSRDRGQRRRGGLTDVSAMGLTCAGCSQPVTHLPFTPKTDSPVRCMGCHDGGAKKERATGGARRDEAVVMDVVFAKKFFGDPRHGDERIVTYISTGDGDSIIGFRRSVRFVPKLNGQTYNCKVYFKENQNGAFAIVEPALPYQLSTKEWLPLDELLTVTTVELVFEMRPPRGGGQPRLIAFHNGRATFPDKGTTIQAGRRTLCLLREDGNVQFAIPISIDQGNTSTGLVKMFEKAGHIQLADLSYVVLETAKAKPGVGRPKTEQDVEIKQEYRSIYDLLSDPDSRITVNEKSNVGEIMAAHRKQTRKVHPDTVLASFGGEASAPLVIKLNVKKFFNAVEQAYKQAIDILERKAEKSTKHSEDKGRRDRRQEGAPVASAPAPVVAPAPVAVEEAASAATSAEGGSASGGDIAPVEASPEPETVAVAAQAEAAEAAEPAEASDEAVKGLAKALKVSVEVLLVGVAKSGKSIVDFSEMPANLQRHYLRMAQAKK